ncbi:MULTISPECIES: ABC transporter ATP-binding protein [unclassified Paenibacillus]|uniref:ABC transporter ATP-binding protein n=1 Tax=unclassified Paenibacillus TaxID=185978 RepID=UPI0009561E53|nr:MULTISPECIES: ABC transporter ATP-binding protein [unclassified Paenibacillus]ASS67504.1 ABC transporter ATP-binding protein [Paenibacillus sp. RUD330]SIQ74664.1 ABC-2 type transport system ATP-binding protein [Paenibacillus sp. RU4X]SIQ96103.1 ABC-2 type transport system ATP-binding protein [Paenibacillus sp. RU4T]
MPFLEIARLSKSFGSKEAVGDLSFTVGEGRCAGLLGPNGAGKTTTLLMLAGLLPPSGGSISFDGKSGGDIRPNIGYLPQYPAYPNWMSGREFLAFTGRLARLGKKEAADRSSELLERVGLADAADRRIGGYSGGMKQRLGIAQAIIHRPKLLLLDEPVSALDPLGRREVLELLQELKQETTILFSTHVLHDAEAVCDDILIIRDGRIALGGELLQVMREHTEPVLTVRFAEPRAEWTKALAGLPCVRQADSLPAGVKLALAGNPEAAKTSVLQAILENGISISSLETGQSTLEDLFVKAVRP